MSAKRSHRSRGLRHVVARPVPVSQAQIDATLRLYALAFGERAIPRLPVKGAAVTRHQCRDAESEPDAG